MNSLKATLALPSHSIFDSGMHNDYTHNETVGPDTMDKDHGSMQPPHPPSTLRPSPTPTLTARGNDSDSDYYFRLGLEVV